MITVASRGHRIRRHDAPPPRDRARYAARVRTLPAGRCMQHADRSFMGGLPLGRVMGIPIRVHVSLLVIFGLIVLQLGAAGLPDSHPLWKPWLVWTVAVAAAF